MLIFEDYCKKHKMRFTAKHVVPLTAFYVAATLVPLCTFPQPAIAKQTVPHKSSAPLYEERKHTIESITSRYAIRIEYPTLGNEVIDSALAMWALRQSDLFSTGLDDIPEQDTSKFSLTITFDLFAVSPQVNSIIFYISTETGNVDKELGIATFTYNLETNQLLDFDDIFDNTYNLLSFFSTRCYQALETTPWATETEGLLRAGTMPIMENFTFFTLTPTGITLYFPPSQVSPDRFGLQKVSFSLADLQAFQPKTSLWKKKSLFRHQTDF